MNKINKIKVNNVEYDIEDASKYSKPYTGIPKSDLQNDIKTSLEKADNSISDAPSDNKQYARKNGNWEEVRGGGSGGTTNHADLSNLDYEHSGHTGFASSQDIQNLNNNKVDKIPEKGLSTNDFTTEEKNKLASLSNYNDTEVKSDIENLDNSKQDNLISGTNIKTINGENLLGSGNIEIQGGSGSGNELTYEDLDMPSVAVESCGFIKEDDKLKLEVTYAPGGVVTLDSEAYKNRTYREIFETANIAPTNFLTNDDFSSQSISGNPIAFTEVYNTAPTSFKCFGTTSQQVRKNLTVNSGKQYYAAAKVKVDRWVKGACGIEWSGGGTFDFEMARVTDGFETVSGIITATNASISFYTGTMHTANCDGYVDSVVLVDISTLFVTPVEKYKMDELYENYLILKNGGQPLVSSNVTYVVNTEVEDVDNFTDLEAHTLFVNEMNAKCALLGMSNTNFLDASGMDSGSQISAKDGVRLGIASARRLPIVQTWGKKTFTFDTLGTNRTISMNSTVTNAILTHSLTDTYDLLGGKTGTLSGVMNLIAIVKHNDIYFCGCILGATTSDRFIAMKQLIDEAVAKYNDPDYVVVTDNIQAQYAAASVLPMHNELFENHEIEFLVDKSGDTQILPASTTKLMTSILLSDWVKDLDDKIELSLYDLATYRGNLDVPVQQGDIMSFREALNLILLPSQNIVADSIGRIVGHIMHDYRRSVKLKYDK